MSALNFDQKKTWQRLNVFLEADIILTLKTNGNTSMHVETQKMCYLLKMAGG